MKWHKSFVVTLVVLDSFVGLTKVLSTKCYQITLEYCAGRKMKAKVKPKIGAIDQNIFIYETEFQI